MTIDIEITDGVAVITMNRPESMNTLDADAYRGLSAAFTRVRDDDDIQGAIVTGAGERAFCVGVDLTKMNGELSGTPLSQYWKTQQGMLVNRGLDVWKPVVAAVNGHCLAGGFTLLLATDLRVSVPEATFGLAEVRRGIMPGNGGTQRILDQVPYAIAMQIALTGAQMSAEDALRWGLVNKIVPREELMDAAFDHMQLVLRNGPLAVYATKEAIIRSREMSWDSGLRLEQSLSRMIRFTEDAKEGPAAFLEKREPNYEGK